MCIQTLDTLIIAPIITCLFVFLTWKSHSNSTLLLHAFLSVLKQMKSLYKSLHTSKLFWIILELVVFFFFEDCYTHYLSCKFPKASESAVQSLIHECESSIGGEVDLFSVLKMLNHSYNYYCLNCGKLD